MEQTIAIMCNKQGQYKKPQILVLCNDNEIMITVTVYVGSSCSSCCLCCCFIGVEVTARFCVCSVSAVVFT